MSQQTNISRRPGSPIYYARVTLPVVLQRARAKAGLPARREVWRSLRTSDLRLATRSGPAVVEQIKCEFDRELEVLARGELPEIVRRHVPTEHEIEERLFALLTADLREDQFARASYARAQEKEQLFADAVSKVRVATEGIKDPQQVQLLAVVASLDELVAIERKDVRAEQRRIERETILAGDPRDSFGHLAEALIEDSRWAVISGSPLFSFLCQRLQSMRLRALDTMEQRDAGRYDDAPRAPPPNVVTMPQKATAKRGERLLELLDKYLEDEGPRLSPEEIEKKRMVIRFFSEHVGVSRSITSIARSDLRTFKQALETFPLSATRKREFRGLEFAAIVAKNAKLRRPSIGRSTQNNYISTVSAYWRWLHANAYTDEVDLSRGLLKKVNKRETARNSYSPDEIAAMMQLPVFAGAASIDDVGQRGEVLVGDWRFWIPLLCLFTGSRLGEIAQLRVKDVQLRGDELTLHITDEGEGMTVKNKHSVRVVPVHRELRRLGFDNFLDTVKSRNVDRLFPDLKSNRRGRSSSAAGTWWRKYLKKHGIDGNAYRFRHTFADALRDAGALDAEIGSLLGHSGGTMTEHYGNVSQVTLARRAALVNGVHFEDVEVLKPRSRFTATLNTVPP